MLPWHRTPKAEFSFCFWNFNSILVKVNRQFPTEFNIIHIGSLLSLYLYKMPYLNLIVLKIPIFFLHRDQNSLKI